MIDVEARVAERRIEQTVRELKYVSSNSFLAGLALRQKADEALSYLKSIFPEGSGVNDQNEFGMHLKDGFFANYYAEGAKVGFTIGHQLSRQKRAQTVLRSLDTGSQEFSYIAQSTFHFLADPSALGRRRSKKAANIWVTIYEGQEVHRGAREGVFYTDRTEEFIARTILPEVKQEWSEKVAARFEAIK
jgi:hypothetical protein